MRRSPLCAAVGLMLLLAATAPVGARGAQNQSGVGPLVTTVGEHIIRRAPDRAFVIVTSESRARQSAEAQQQAARATSAIVAALKGAGVAADGIRTLAYAVHPEFDSSGGRQRLVGFVARQDLEVRIDDLDRLGAILDLAVGAGATTVTGVRFDLRDRRTLEREALRGAVADALARAEAAAAGAGRTLARVERIEETRLLAEPPRPWLLAARPAEAGPETPVAPGSVEIRAEVRLTAVLK
jgi:uncharacterized protein YggE